MQGDKTIAQQSVDLPAVPLFLCDAGCTWIELEEIAATERALFRPRPAKKFEFIAYAADEAKWIMRYESPGFSVWTRLTRIFHKPKIVVPVEWARQAKYDLRDLRAAFLKAVEHDDDVLTQFKEPADVVGRLNATDSFTDFVKVWAWLGMDA